MASNSVSNSTKEGSPKRLAELLDQQQEPFVLEVYLNERGINKKRSSGFEGVSFGCLFRGKRLSKGSTKNVGLSCTSDAARICNRIEKEATTMEESGRLSSSGSFSAEFNSCSGSDVEDISTNGSQSRKQLNHQTDEDAADDEMVQCSPISVLDEIKVIPNVTPSRLSFSFPKDYIFSASLWELFVCKRKDKRVGVASKNSGWRHMNSKKALQQTTRLVFDCVEDHKQPRKSRHLKIICEKIRCWDKQSVDGKKKIIKLLRSDLLSSYQEKHHRFDGFTEEVVKEVGDRILEEMTDEIVHLYLSKSHQICYDS